MYKISGIETIEYKEKLVNKYYVSTSCEEGEKPFGTCLGDFHLRAGDIVSIEFGNSRNGFYIKTLRKENANDAGN